MRGSFVDAKQQIFSRASVSDIAEDLPRSLLFEERPEYAQISLLARDISDAQRGRPVNAITGVVRVPGEAQGLQRETVAPILLQRPLEAHLALLVQVAPDIRKRQVAFRPGRGKARPHMLLELAFTQRERCQRGSVLAGESIENGGGRGLRRRAGACDRDTALTRCGQQGDQNQRTTLQEG